MPVSIDVSKKMPQEPEWLLELRRKMETVDEMDCGMEFFAQIHEVPANFLELLSEKEASKIRIHGAGIYVRNNEGPVHKSAVNSISTDIGTSTSPSGRSYVLSPSGSLILVNKFLCGMLVKKIPDALFSTEDVDAVEKISLEVAFSNENLFQLLMESVHVLTEYSTIEYSIAVKIFKHSDNNRFDALLFAMKRAPQNPAPQSNQGPCQVKLAYEKNGIQPNYDCQENFQGEFPFDNVAEQRRRFGVEIFFQHFIDEGNFNQDIIIPINRIENILIHSDSIAFIRRNYQIWWERKHARQTTRSE